MKHTMERRLEVDLNRLGDDLKSTSCGLKQVRMETQALAASLRQETGDRGLEKIKVKEYADDVVMLKLSLQALERRAEANTEGRRAFRAELDDVAAAASKL